MVYINRNMNQEILSTKSDLKNCDEDGLTMLVKNVIEINSQYNLLKLPNDFDSWTLKKQYDWINQNIANFLPNLPQSLLNLIPANFQQLDFENRSLEELPKWIDMDKYRKGQKFVQKHFAVIALSKIMSLIYMYSFEDQLNFFILGEHSHTPYLGFKRYLLTIKRILNWYTGDPWIKGTRAFKDMQVTRIKHIRFRRKLRQMDHKKIAAACTFANPWCPDLDLLLKDFTAVCPAEKFGQRPHILLKKSPYKPTEINNFGFAMAQSCLIVLPVLYPQNFGIYDATDEDLESFCHMWKCYGYFLGIEDEYNFCRGNLEETKQRLRDFYQYCVIPNFKELTPKWEHIARCLVVSMNYYSSLYLPFKVAILLATEALNLNMVHLYASLNFTEWILYKIYKFILYTQKFSSMRTIFNKIIRSIFEKALNFNEEKLEEIHEKSKKLVPDFSIMY